MTYTSSTVKVVLACMAGFAMAATSSDLAVAADPAKPSVVGNMPLDGCLQSGSQSTVPSSRASIEQRIVACSAAIQSRKLTPGELAVARLNRGAARMALGETILASGDYREALRHYDNAIDSNAPDALALYRRGVAQYALGQTDKALSDFNAAIRLDPKEPLAYFERAILLAARKRAYDRAVADFEKVLVLAPDDIDTLIRRGDAQGQMGDFGRALADLDRAVRLAPDRSDAYVYRGRAKSRQGDIVSALSDYNAAIKLDPRNVEALVSRAALYSTNRQDDLALRDLDAAVAVDGSNPVALYNRGYAHFAKREYGPAIADYSAAIQLDPEMGLAYNNRCLTRTIVGTDLVGALSDCDRALKADSTNLGVRETRGFIYLKLGDPAISIVEYNAALDVDPNRAVALFGRGLAKIKMGQRKEGDADQAAARALNPSVETQFSTYGVTE